MKKNRKFMVLTTAFLIAFSSCNKEMDINGSSNKKQPGASTPVEVKAVLELNPKSRAILGSMLGAEGQGDIRWIREKGKDYNLVLAFANPEKHQYFQCLLKNLNDGINNLNNPNKFTIYNDQQYSQHTVIYKDTLKDGTVKDRIEQEIDKNPDGTPKIIGARGKLDVHATIKTTINDLAGQGWYVAALFISPQSGNAGDKKFTRPYGTYTTYYDSQQLWNAKHSDFLYVTETGFGNLLRFRDIPVMSAWSKFTVDTENKQIHINNLRMEPRGAILSFKLSNNTDKDAPIPADVANLKNKPDAQDKDRRAQTNDFAIRMIDLKSADIYTDVIFNLQPGSIAREGQKLSFSSVSSSSEHKIYVNNIWAEPNTTSPEGYIWVMPKEGGTSGLEVKYYLRRNNQAYCELKSTDINPDTDPAVTTLPEKGSNPDFYRYSTSIQDGRSYQLPTVSVGNNNDLMITEVMHWNSPIHTRSYNRTIIEIYNPTNNIIDLADYALVRCRNYDPDTYQGGRILIHPRFHPTEDPYYAHDYEGLSGALQGAVAFRLWQDNSQCTQDQNLSGYVFKGNDYLRQYNAPDRFATGTPSLYFRNFFATMKGTYTRYIYPHKTVLYAAGGWLKARQKGYLNKDWYYQNTYGDNDFPKEGSRFWNYINAQIKNKNCEFLVTADDGPHFSWYQWSTDSGVLQMGVKHGLLLLKYKDEDNHSDYKLVDEFAPVLNGYGAFKNFMNNDIKTEVGWTNKDLIDWVRSYTVKQPTNIWSYILSSGSSISPYYQWVKYNNFDSAPFSLGARWRSVSESDATSAGRR